jgi:putative PIG3 family NAD(P)H quinone oxidoreductase
MFAIHIDPDHTLHWAEAPTPTLAAGEVLIEVAACGVNRADLAQRAGQYPPPPGASSILGMECAGHVIALGEGVTQWRLGDAVCALLGGGGYAEYAAVDARHCLPVPAGLSMAEAASLPEVYATAYLNLFMEAGLQAGERVLLPAGASGVGTAAIQLCRLGDNPCIVSVGTAEKLERCLALGATDGVVRGNEAELANLLGGGFDVILDPVGGAQLAEHLSLLRPGGRLVLIAFMGGREATLDLGRILVKRLRLIGSTLRSRSPDAKAELIARLREHLWPAFADGRLKPVLDRVFPVTEAAAAHAHMAANLNVGKLVLMVEGV